MQAILKPHLVLRVEDDDFALLYDPDTGESFVLDPAGVFVCRRLDGAHSMKQIVEESGAVFAGIPEDARRRSGPSWRGWLRRALRIFEKQGGRKRDGIDEVTPYGRNQYHFQM